MALSVPTLRRKKPSLVESLASKATELRTDEILANDASAEYQRQAVEAYAELSTASGREAAKAAEAARQATAVEKAQSILDEAGVTV